MFGHESRSERIKAVRILQLQPKLGFKERVEHLKTLDDSESVDSSVFLNAISYVGFMGVAGLVVGGSGAFFYSPSHSTGYFVGSLFLILLGLFLLLGSLNGFRARWVRKKRNSMHR